MAPTTPPSAMTKAMKLLAIRPLSEQELWAKLRRAGFPDHECDAAIAECARRHYLDDEQLAADCVTSLRQRNLGARMIKQKLMRRGLDKERIGEFLAEDPEAEVEAARRAMEGKLRSLTKETDPGKKREKLFRFMAGRGFSAGIIFKLLDENR